jgi:hypothetical protein
MPANPIGFLQVVQGLQLLHLFVGDLQQGRQQDRSQQPAPQPKVSSDVVETLNRVDTALDDLVKKTNALLQGEEKTGTKKFRDPKYPEVNKSIEVVKPKDHTTASDSKGGGVVPFPK